jgi:hypothetical protein
MLPQFNVNISNTTSEIYQQPSKTYKDKYNSIAGYVDNKQAIEQTVYHILNTERYAYEIYDDNYGMEFEKYIGQPYEYFQATIENDLKSALTQDDRITNIKVTNTQKLSVDSALVEFDVYTTEGIIEMGANFGL